MPEPRFKVGDRVRVKSSGERGRVSRLDGAVVIVEFPSRSIFKVVEYRLMPDRLEIEEEEAADA